MITGVELNNPALLKPFDENFQIQLPLVGLKYDYDSDAYRAYAKEIRDHYFGDKPVDKDSIPEYVQMTSDTFFVYAMDRAVRSQAKRSTGNTFYLK